VAHCWLASGAASQPVACPPRRGMSQLASYGKYRRDAPTRRTSVTSQHKCDFIKYISEFSIVFYNKQRHWRFRFSSFEK
jgi:hypothetical protein